VAPVYQQVNVSSGESLVRFPLFFARASAVIRGLLGHRDAGERISVILAAKTFRQAILSGHRVIAVVNGGDG